jgi:hypothetical protein
MHPPVDRRLESMEDAAGFVSSISANQVRQQASATKQRK